MRRAAQLLLSFALLASLVSCARKSNARPGRDPDVIQRGEVLAGSYATAHDAVRALHPNWLVSRSSGRRAASTPIWVYVDGNRYGDVSWLRNIPAQGIASIRRIDGITATTRWGTGHTEGVLYVTTFVPSGDRER